MDRLKSAFINGSVDESICCVLPLRSSPSVCAISEEELC